MVSGSKPRHPRLSQERRVKTAIRGRKKSVIMGKKKSVIRGQEWRKQGITKATRLF